jgi:hypothetical protein
MFGWTKYADLPDEDIDPYDFYKDEIANWDARYQAWCKANNANDELAEKKPFQDAIQVFAKIAAGEAITANGPRPGEILVWSDNRWMPRPAPKAPIIPPHPTCIME